VQYIASALDGLVGPFLMAIIEESQRKAARVVGSTYLFTNLTPVFALFYVRAEPRSHG